eukprot:CAMPEP_0194308018 /NCGR_PEP_ID=MMETSP0171-20130528/4943_1 /TAXON_ID=218684 /ORGANISM="Corethron pennatum, Strain L29A3" /LENGTH=45 /DNA_ID= /DNA_START= /DNA_END= /DNA_ORIENTATION=
MLRRIMDILRSDRSIVPAAAVLRRSLVVGWPEEHSLRRAWFTAVP